MAQKGAKVGEISGNLKQSIRITFWPKCFYILHASWVKGIQYLNKDLL